MWVGTDTLYLTFRNSVEATGKLAHMTRDRFITRVRDMLVSADRNGSVVRKCKRAPSPGAPRRPGYLFPSLATLRAAYTRAVKMEGREACLGWGQAPLPGMRAATAAPDAARYRAKYEGAVVGRRAAATAIAHWYKVDRYDRACKRGYCRRERVRLRNNTKGRVARLLFGRLKGYSYEAFMMWLDMEYTGEELMKWFEDQ